MAPTEHFADHNHPNDPLRRGAQRLRGFTSTIFAEMSALAVRTQSINLGQGFPDQSGPDSVAEAAVDAIRSGINQYPPGHGNPALIDAIRRHQKRHYGIDLTPEEVVITTGATEAIAAAILGLIDPGDEVVVIEPFYDSYPAMIHFAGGVRRVVTVRAPDFTLDEAALAAAITPRTKAVLINTPHNPTGHVFSADELAMVARVAIAHDLIVISDEVYEHLTFDDHPHIPIATLPGMFERTVTISSSGKTFSFTGWKIGWASGPADLVAAVEAAKNWLSYSSGAPFQPAIAHALDHEEDFHRGLQRELDVKRQRMCAALSDLGLGVHIPQGTYFISTDVRPLGFASGTEFCRSIADRVHVVAIPSAAFYDHRAEGDPFVRWAFCKNDNVLDEGLRRLGRM